MKFTVINGPNLCLLGKRNREIYGSDTLDTMNEEIKEYADSLSVETDFFVSNHEGALLDRLQECISDGTDAVLLNAGALTHYSYSLRDCIEVLADVGIPVWEVHLSDIDRREDFRKVSVIREVCAGTVSGLGKKSYTEALDQALCCIKSKNDNKE